jgi:hypothetical protein
MFKTLLKLLKLYFIFALVSFPFLLVVFVLVPYFFGDDNTLILKIKVDSMLGTTFLEKLGVFFFFFLSFFVFAGADFTVYFGVC